ncbi:kinase-like domain-containing protein [Phascolomyces articulosus]|uniref:Kinase-like domain-containing protein n=1 Tax=Phascolomyces articulosus TaxID=60185 RepID=A0AAD5PC09_9FUNG|nr:kinase-like domain-containing protein [Phascolomyces articulosus]
MRNIRLPIAFLEPESSKRRKKNASSPTTSNPSTSTAPRIISSSSQQQQQQNNIQFTPNNTSILATNNSSSRSLPSSTTSSSTSSDRSSIPYTDSILSHYDGTHLEIAAIESTLMVQDYDVKKKKRVRRVLTVFNIIIEDRHFHRSLVRYVSDFVEFDRKVKKYYRKSKISLPSLVEPDIHLYGTGKRASIRAFLLRFARRQYDKPNSEKIETYLRQCALDPTVGRSSLFRDFLTRQRPEDKAVPRESIDNYYQHHIAQQHQEQQQQQQQQQPSTSYMDTTASSSGGSMNHRDRSSMSIIEVPNSSNQNNNSNNHHSYYKNDNNDSSDDYNNYNYNYDYNIPSSSSAIITVPAPVLAPTSDDDAIVPSSPIASISMEEESPHRTSSMSRYISTTSDESLIQAIPPPTIQDYKFLRVLGKGCMGKVLLVQSYRSPTRLLALKAISKENVIKQREIEHIKVERDILTTLAQIRHPFLIQLHHAFQSADQLFLVLDYHRGGDMATQLAKFHSFSPERCQLYAAEILLGLQELHSLGILYRDLKPENILIAADGHIVLTDFGLSKQFASAENMDDKCTGTFCGTAEYLAPEILKSEPYNYAVDLWSLGTILYEMIEGTPPFYEQAHSEMYRRIMDDELEFTQAFDPISQDFIGRLLRKHPDERLGTEKNGGPEVIRSHSYFASLDWSDVYHKRIRPEYVPHLRSETDLSNFDRDFLIMTPRLSPVSNPDIYSDSVQEIFQGYSFINDSSNYTFSLISEEEEEEEEEDDPYQLQQQRQEHRIGSHGTSRSAAGTYSDDYSGSDIRSDDFNRGIGYHEDEGFSTTFHPPPPRTLL